MLYTSFYGQETVELALRVWLCGGVVLRQSCSRVAQAVQNIFHDQPVGNGVTQEMIDLNALNIANKWFSNTNNGFNEYKEVVYQARFTNRIPYMVETSTDPIHTAPYIASYSVSSTQLLTCMKFSWYLTEIYPGLLSDVKEVEKNYKNYLSSDYLLDALGPFSSQYTKEGEFIRSDLEILKAREISLLSTTDSKNANLKNFNTFFIKSNDFKPPPLGVNSKKAFESKDVDVEDRLALFAQKVRTNLICEDMPLFNDEVPCSKRGQGNNCNDRKADLLFTCPKTCGFCDSHGLFCEDFYLKKCINIFLLLVLLFHIVYN
jgi:hypothetical protein